MKRKVWSEFVFLVILAGCGGGDGATQLCPKGCPDGYVCTVQGTCVPNMPLPSVDSGSEANASQQRFDSGGAGVAVDGTVLAHPETGMPDTVAAAADAATTEVIGIGPPGTGDASGGLDSTTAAERDAGGNDRPVSTVGPDSAAYPTQDTLPSPPDLPAPTVDAFAASTDLPGAAPDTVPQAQAPDAFVPCQPQKAMGNSPTIDDLADGDANIILQEGRSGTWYVYNDGTGTQVPAPGATVSPTNNRICTSGFGFTSWGSGVGVNLNTDNVNVCTYDASVYRGVRFTIEGTITNSYLRFAIPTKDIASPDASGACNSTLYKCNDNYGANIYYSTTAGFYCANALGTFACTSPGPGNSLIFSIPFAQMTQEGWGQAFPAFDLTKILSAHWEIKNSSRLNSSSYTLCMGAIGFY